MNVKQDGTDCLQASFQGKDRFERQNAIQDMLITYRSMPHSATGITPYKQ